jgi:hypothetical protein
MRCGEQPDGRGRTPMNPFAGRAGVWNAPVSEAVAAVESVLDQ